MLNRVPVLEVLEDGLLHHVGDLVALQRGPHDHDGPDGGHDVVGRHRLLLLAEQPLLLLDDGRRRHADAPAHVVARLAAAAPSAPAAVLVPVAALRGRRRRRAAARRAGRLKLEKLDMHYTFTPLVR